MSVKAEVSNQDNQYSNNVANFNSAVAQWEEEQQIYDKMKQELEKQVAELKYLLDHGHVQQAFNKIQVVMLSMTKLNTDKIGMEAAALNIAAAEQAFVQEAQNDVNSGSKMTQAQAEDLVKVLKFVESQLSGKTPPWINASTAQTLKAAINQICKLFGADNPNDLNANTVKTDITKWYGHPAHPTEIQQLQAGFTQWNNTASSYSQDLQTTTSFMTQQLSQVMTTLANIYKDTEGWERASTQNQRVS